MVVVVVVKLSEKIADQINQQVKEARGDRWDLGLGWVMWPSPPFAPWGTVT